MSHVFQGRALVICIGRGQLFCVHMCIMGTLLLAPLLHSPKNVRTLHLRKCFSRHSIEEQLIVLGFIYINTGGAKGGAILQRFQLFLSRFSADLLKTL